MSDDLPSRPSPNTVDDVLQGYPWYSETDRADILVREVLWLRRELALARYSGDGRVPIADLAPLVRLMGEPAADLDGDDCARMLSLVLAKHSPPTQPNPHPVGTYLWAREEHARGREVRVHGWIRSVEPTQKWDEQEFLHCWFVASDWEVVK